MQKTMFCHVYIICNRIWIILFIFWRRAWKVMANGYHHDWGGSLLERDDQIKTRSLTGTCRSAQWSIMVYIGLLVFQIKWMLGNFTGENDRINKNKSGIKNQYWSWKHTDGAGFSTSGSFSPLFLGI